MKNAKLTSVKVLKELYNDFKIDSVSSNMTLQKLTNRSIHLYLSNEIFRNSVDTHKDLTISGSSL